MKKNWKFTLSVICIILSSVLVLTGCMAAITASADTTHPYQLSTIPKTDPDTKSNSGADTTNRDFIIIPGAVELQADPDLTEPPVSQEELKDKFSVMYEFSEENEAVTVISELYLADLWNINDENEVVRSLSIPEVLYIIQDSIRIYNEYNTIVLPGFPDDVPNAAVSIEYPTSEQRITPNPEDRDQAREDVRKIILYRLQALSSPEAFFTVAEMLEYRNIDPETVPDICRDVFFYIPNYSADTNRDLYLIDANYQNSRSKFGVFCFSYFNRITLFTTGNPETVFPTSELSLTVQDGEVIYLEMSPDWILKPEYYDTLLGVPSFVFNPEEQTFYLTTTGAHFDLEKNCVVLEKDCHDFKKWPGTYEKTGDRLYLYPVDIPDAVFVFDCDADGTLSFNEAESNQAQITFEDNAIYQPIDHEP